MAGIFASITLLIIGFNILFREMSFSFNTVFYACKIAIPGSLFAGLCGYAIGRVAETADFSKQKTTKNKKNHHNNNKESGILIDDLLEEDIEQFSKAEAEGVNR